jgi:hypothetical protein
MRPCEFDAPVKNKQNAPGISGFGQELIEKRGEEAGEQSCSCLHLFSISAIRYGKRCKGPASSHPDADGNPQTLPENSGIRCFIWEHANDVHHIMH